MGLTDKQKRFCEEYMRDFNATQAAIRAGYSEKTAFSIGSENLRKPEIRGFIDAKLKTFALSADEVLKSLSDIAKSNLNDYFVIKEVVQTPKIKKHLTEVIADINAAIEDADKFIQRAGITDEKFIEQHLASQQTRRHEILRLQIELERNPQACRWVAGEPELVKAAELDLPKLVQDKEAGRIKSVKPTEHGLNVELYAADAALRDLARYHGLFEKDNSQLKPENNELKIIIVESPVPIAESEDQIT